MLLLEGSQETGRMREPRYRLYVSWKKRRARQSPIGESGKRRINTVRYSGFTYSGSPVLVAKMVPIQHALGDQNARITL